MIHIPKFDQMMNPLLQALKELGGSGTIEEIDNKVVEIMALSDEQLEVLHNPERGGKSKIEYRLGWTRTYLKKYDLIENSQRGIWALTKKGNQVDKISPSVVKREVRKKANLVKDTMLDEIDEENGGDSQSWRDQLHDTLLQMDPSAFERLVQRLLRESGFIQVEVTGKSGDGGIDGKGIMRLGGLLSFHVIFQCKRYRGSVGSSTVRDFRGAMVGRADKGLLITTGNFTREAEREATRDGAPAIDLIDGELLISKLQELELGVFTKLVQQEVVEVDHDWFSTI